MDKLFSAPHPRGLLCVGNPREDEANWLDRQSERRQGCPGHVPQARHTR